MFTKMAAPKLLRSTMSTMVKAVAQTQYCPIGREILPKTMIPVFSTHQEMMSKPNRGIRMVFLGAPGVGKGTNASRLSQFLKVPHISMGDLVRNELTSSHLKKIMASGKLLPDETILDLLMKRLESGKVQGEYSGFILDGFPRTLNQAKILAEVADIDVVVNLRLREDVLVAKCLGRRMCSGCGCNFNVADIVDIDGIHMPAILPCRDSPCCARCKIITRVDDMSEEVVRARLQVYCEESGPVERFYRSRGLLVDFDVRGGVHETWSRLLSALGLLKDVNGSMKLAALGSH